MPSYRIEEITSPEFEKRAGERGGVIIPFGSVEAHGAHLPLSSDTLQGTAVAELVAERTGLLLAPAIPYGVCVSTRDHPGTVTLKSETLKLILFDLVASFRRQGIRTFIILSGHAGKSHLAALRDAGESILENDPDIRMMIISEYDLIMEKAGPELETADDSHAGELETSRIMHLAPELVKGTSPEEYPSFSPYTIEADKRSRWPGSVWGNPSAADREKGRLFLERSARAICSIIDQESEF